MSSAFGPKDLSGIIVFRKVKLYGIVQGKDPEIYDVTLSVAPSR